MLRLAFDCFSVFQKFLAQHSLPFKTVPSSPKCCINYRESSIETFCNFRIKFVSCIFFVWWQWLLVVIEPFLVMSVTMEVFQLRYWLDLVCFHMFKWSQLSSPKCFHWIQWLKIFVIKRVPTCSLQCKRPRRYHSTSKIQMRDRIDPNSCFSDLSDSLNSLNFRSI